MTVWIVLILFAGPPAALPGISFPTELACRAFAAAFLGPLPHVCVAVERAVFVG